ncbi:MAG TPA: hypothetical protein VES20_12975 [Bryobacteraceae bacterium]|nr:hypothetical protein [Bryobacteraceae bacterium]
MAPGLRSERVPFPIAVQRCVRESLTVLHSRCGPDSLPRFRDLKAGECFELCDIENESALLCADDGWYRAHIDDIVDQTGPMSPTAGVV